MLWRYLNYGLDYPLYMEGLEFNSLNFDNVDLFSDRTSCELINVKH